MSTGRTGPLAGLKVVELVGLGPGPFGAMILADLGADVVAVVRPSEAAAASPERPGTLFDRGKRSVALDLKVASDVERLLGLCERADALIDPFRPGVCERLGIGPDVVLARNPSLIYGRITGWGQDGPLAHAAGHDLTYIALAGALYPLGRAGQPPTPPINVLGDFAGGGMLLALGIASAAFARERDPQRRGQVIDAAMVDGSALVMAPFYAAYASGNWGPRGTNHLDTGSHFYEVYETADGGWIAIGPIEPQFYAELLARLGLDPAEYPQWDRSRWPELKARFAALFASRTRDEWCRLLEGTDVCFAPVLTPDEAPRHPHNAHRGTFIEVAGVPQPAPAPRFSRTAPGIPAPAPYAGRDSGHIDTIWR